MNSLSGWYRTEQYNILLQYKRRKSDFSQENNFRANLYRKISEDKYLAMKFKYDAERKKNGIKFGASYSLNKKINFKGMIDDNFNVMSALKIDLGSKGNITLCPSVNLCPLKSSDNDYTPRFSIRANFGDFDKNDW